MSLIVSYTQISLVKTLRDHRDVIAVTVLVAIFFQQKVSTSGYLGQLSESRAVPLREVRAPSFTCFEIGFNSLTIRL